MSKRNCTTGWSLILLVALSLAACASEKITIRQVDADTSASTLHTGAEQTQTPSDDLAKSDQAVDLGFTDQSKQAIVIEAGQEEPPADSNDASLFDNKAGPAETATQDANSTLIETEDDLADSEDGSVKNKKKGDDKKEKKQGAKDAKPAKNKANSK